MIKNLYTKILINFLNKKGQFLLIEKIIQKYNISNIEFLNFIQIKEQEGYKFYFSSSLNFCCLFTSNFTLNQILFEEYLRYFQCNLKVFYKKTTDSTNNEAKHEISKNIDKSFIVISEKMTNGKGRMGRQWVADSDGGIYLTFGLIPKITIHKIQLFSLWITLQICKFIKYYTKLTLSIKWPNDILIQKKKIGGVLFETSINKNKIKYIILGVGINLNGSLVNLPDLIRNKATSIELESGYSIEMNKFTALLTVKIFNFYQTFISQLIYFNFSKLWNEFDFFNQKLVLITVNSISLIGINLGIDNNGCILIKTKEGELKRFSMEEVTLSSCY